MSEDTAKKTAWIRARLNHPVIDADGHWREFPPILMESMRRIGGEKAVAGLRSSGARTNKLAVGVDGEGAGLNGIPYAAQKRRPREPQGGWWLSPWSTRDRATAVLPRLLYERLDEIGLDFLVLFGTFALGLPAISEPEERRATFRAYNINLAEQFAKYADRITPVAPIPMHTPEEALEELDHAVGELGLKAVMLCSVIRRPLPDRPGNWMDMLGLDSAYNYDPVWAKCEELGVSPSFHTSGNGIGLRVSPSNFVYNHIGHFASAGDAVCKSLFLAGVTRRFPRLRFGFMEGGAGWACNLYNDLVGHWKKRHLPAINNLRPSNLDREQFLSLAQRYGGQPWAEYLKDPSTKLDRLGLLLTVGIDVPEPIDDFAACGIERAEQFRDLFAARFYFGCEPDDPTVAWAFNSKTNAAGARLHALFSSDISHFDVPDMCGVLPEAYELVEEELIDRRQFADFVFGNAARFLTACNPRFFEGTRVAAAVRELLAASQPPANL